MPSPSACRHWADWASPPRAAAAVQTRSGAASHDPHPVLALDLPYLHARPAREGLQQAHPVPVRPGRIHHVPPVARHHPAPTRDVGCDVDTVFANRSTLHVVSMRQPLHTSVEAASRGFSTCVQTRHVCSSMKHSTMSCSCCERSSMLLA